MSDTALLLKHYRLLAKNIDSLSDGQARLKPADEDTDQEDSLTTILVTLSPRTGPYRGGQFDFELDLSEGYPTSPPVVRSQTPMYHPNVDCCWDYSEGDVCLNLLDELWTSEMTLEDVVQGLLFLLHEPNLEDPLNSLFDGTEEEEEFHRNVRKSLRGGMEVNGVYFERNLMDGYDSECEDVVAPVNQNKIEETLEMPSSLVCLLELDETPVTHTTNNTSIPPSPPPPPHPPSCLTHTLETDPLLTSTSIESSVDKEPPASSSSLFSQHNLSFNAFDKMWTLSLRSITRTIVLGAQRMLPARLDSSSVDVR